jgi:[acyl-carrier-protein] S-malonyltransferase
MTKLACLFPGQGSQSVGMGRDLYDNFEIARTTFDTIDTIAKRKLSALCFAGPEAELKRTVNTQPTILAASLASWRCYEYLRGPKPDFVAGHSLGEFTALVAAGVLPQEAAVQLVDKRAQLMESCPQGAMSAVIGLAYPALEAACRRASDELSASGKVVIVANLNTREQLVISGHPEAVHRAGELAKESGGKVIPLPVGGAFHSPLMSTAAQEFGLELNKHQFVNAAYPVVQNCDATAQTLAPEIKARLAKQMSSAVHWYESIEYMLGQGVATFVEIGPGKVLAGMVKKVDKSARVFNIFDKTSLESTIAELRQVTTVL